MPAAEARMMVECCADGEEWGEQEEIVLLAALFEDPQIEVVLVGPSGNSYPQPDTTKCC